ncbi:hypothetical protein CG017_05044 [Burkholderia glumae]|nr:hypothetical protein CG017_05044 [Burkholderia glumae]
MSVRHAVSLAVCLGMLSPCAFAQFAGLPAARV